MATAFLSEDAKLYYNTGSYASPTWTLICNVKDLTLNMSNDETDTTTRCGGGTREYIAGLTDISITFNMLYDPADTPWEAIRAAFMTKASLEFLCLDGLVATAGSEGLRATMVVTSFNITQTLGDTIMTDVTLRPTPNANAAPAWYTAS